MEVSHILPSPCLYMLPHCQLPLPRAAQAMNCHSHTFITRSAEFTSVFTHGVAPSGGLDKSIMTSVHHEVSYRVISLPPNPCAHLFTPVPWPLATTDVFPVSVVLLFPKGCTVGTYSTQSFQTGFFHLVTCIYISRGSFHGLKARFPFQR